MMEKAMFVRLNNGDDLLADVEELLDDAGMVYVLNNPLKILYKMEMNEKYTYLHFTPWVYPSLCDRQEFVVHTEDILFISEVTDKIDKHYRDSLDIYYRDFVEPSTEDVEEEMDDMLMDLLPVKGTPH